MVSVHRAHTWAPLATQQMQASSLTLPQQQEPQGLAHTRKLGGPEGWEHRWSGRRWVAAVSHGRSAASQSHSLEAITHATLSKAEDAGHVMGNSAVIPMFWRRAAAAHPWGSLGWAASVCRGHSGLKGWPQGRLGPGPLPVSPAQRSRCPRGCLKVPLEQDSGACWAGWSPCPLPLCEELPSPSQPPNAPPPLPQPIQPLLCGNIFPEPTPLLLPPPPRAETMGPLKALPSI